MNLSLSKDSEIDPFQGEEEGIKNMWGDYEKSQASSRNQQFYNESNPVVLSQ